MNYKKINTLRKEFAWEQKGISKKALAKRAGISYATLYALEIGRRSPTLKVLQKLAKALNVTVTDLL